MCIVEIRNYCCLFSWRSTVVFLYMCFLKFVMFSFITTHWTIHKITNLNICSSANFFSKRPHANIAPTDTISTIQPSFQSLQLRIGKLQPLVNTAHPKAQTVSKILTSPSCSGTFNKRRCSEILQTRARAWHVLSASIGTLARVREKRVTEP